MRVIIAGSRGIHDDAAIARAMEEAAEAGIVPTEVVSGRAQGVDAAGERWALARGLPVRGFPADWGKYGRAGGPVRNRAMAEYAQALVAIHDGVSRGTANMIETMKSLGKPVVVVRCGPE